MQVLSCSMNDAIYPALPRQGICQCTMEICAMKTCTALLPQLIAISVEPSDFLTGVYELYEGRCHGFSGLALAVFFLGWTKQY
jgi:hypothetical protein